MHFCLRASGFTGWSHRRKIFCATGHSVQFAMSFLKTTILGLLALVGVTAAGLGAEPGRKTLHGHIPAVVAHLTSQGRLPATNHLSLALGLPLRNQDELAELLQQLYDPRSTNFHKFLTAPEFTARFGPTEADYQAVRRFVENYGLTVVRAHPNRVVMDVAGSVANVESAFGVSLQVYHHPTEARGFFAPDAEPSVPTNLPVADLWGLSDYALPRPLSHIVNPAKISPLNYNGTGPGGSYQGSDFRNVYASGSSLAGSDQIAAVAEFDGYYTNDIARSEERRVGKECRSRW